MGWLKDMAAFVDDVDRASLRIHQSRLRFTPTDATEGTAEMSYCQDLARALRDEMRHLRHQVAARDTMPVSGPIPPRFSPDQAMAILRIEATFEAVDSLRACRDFLSFVPSASAFNHDQPLTFLGVALYEVRHPLPAPGWRIINPMRTA